VVPYVHQSILEGYQDIADRRYFKSSGNFKQDMKTLKKGVHILPLTNE